jgi:hypothetical protein
MPTPSRPVALSLSIAVAATAAAASNTTCSPNNNGGFAPPTQLQTASLCEIDAVHLSQLSLQTFLTKYAGKRPVLIRGGVSHWTAQTKWTRSYLRPYLKTGNVDQYNSNSHHNDAHGTLTSGVTGTAGPTFSNYLFRKLDHGHLSFPTTTTTVPTVDLNVLQDTVVPAYFSSAWNLTSLKIDYFFSFGGQDTGLSFHTHAEAWNGLVWGRKRWFMVPKTKTSRKSVHRHHKKVQRLLASIEKHGRQKWLNKIYPSLKKTRPKQCVQEKGDLMYVPKDTIHAVWNEGEAIGVSSVYYDDLDIDVAEEYVPSNPKYKVVWGN